LDLPEALLGFYRGEGANGLTLVFNLGASMEIFSADGRDAAFDLGAMRFPQAWEIGPGCGLVLLGAP